MPRPCSFFGFHRGRRIWFHVASGRIKHILLHGVDAQRAQILEPGVAQCVIDIIKKIKFAASAKGFETHAHYPFDFHPKTFTPSKPDAGK